MAVIGSISAELLLDRSRFDQGLGKAGITARKFEGDTRASLGRVDRSFSSTFARVGSGGAAAFGALAKGALLALAPIMGVSAALGTAKAAMADFDKIAKNAKASGLSGEAFQEFAYAAELGGVATDEFAKALETFNKNAGLAAVGKGKMITALKALNPELLTNILATQDQAERLKLAADAIDKAASSSQKAALATTLFGEAGTRMVEVLKGGRAALDATAKAARDLGMVIDNQLLARAETLNDEFGTASRVMDLQFKSALIELAPILIATAQLAGNLASAINYMTASMQGLESRSTARLEQDYKGLMATLDAANADYSPGVVTRMGIEIDPDKQASMQAEADAMRAELKRRAIQKLAADLNKPTYEPFDPGTGAAKTRKAAADAAVKQAEAVAKLVADLQHEQEQLGRTNQEQELYGHLKALGIERESEFGQAIEAALGPLQAQRAAIEANKKAMEDFQSIAGDALKGFASDLRQGKSLTEALSDSFGRLGDRLIDMALDNAINALFGNLVGAFGGNFMGGSMGAPSLKLGFQSGIPGYAVGTNDHPGGLARVFERGAEIIDLPKHTRVIPHELSKSMASAQSAASDSSTFHFAPTIDARGADTAAVDKLGRTLAKMQNEFEGRVKLIVKNRSKNLW